MNVGVLRLFYPVASSASSQSPLPALSGIGVMKLLPFPPCSLGVSKWCALVKSLTNLPSIVKCDTIRMIHSDVFRPGSPPPVQLPSLAKETGRVTARLTALDQVCRLTRGLSAHVSVFFRARCTIS